MIHQADSIEDLAWQGAPVVVCFTNPLTCAPCKLFHPHFKAASEKLPKVDFFEVDINEHMDIAHEFGVRGTPTTILISQSGRTPINARTAIPLVAEIVLALRT